MAFNLESHNSVISRIDLTGVDQLTDLFFAMMLYVHQNSVMRQHVTSVSVQGCIHLTDQAVKWMAKMFPKLENVRSITDG